MRITSTLVCAALLAAACKNKDQGTDTTAPTGPAGFDIQSVTGLDAQMRFVADVVQLPDGAVAAVGIDLTGLGAVHLVSAAGVTVLHAGAPLGTPTGVDRDTNGTLFVSDAGGAPTAVTAAPAEVEDTENANGGIYALPETGGAPALVTSAIVSPQGVVAAEGGVLYATGLTAAMLPAVFSIEGTAVTTLAEGPPLVRPGDLSVVGDPDATQLWVIDVSGGQDGVTEGGANLVAILPPASDVIEVAKGMSAIGVTGRGPDALVTNRDANGDAMIQIVDVNDGSRRDVAANGLDASFQATGAGAGGDATLPVWAGGASGLVYTTSN